VSVKKRFIRMALVLCVLAAGCGGQEDGGGSTGERTGNEIQADAEDRSSDAGRTGREDASAGAGQTGREDASAGAGQTGREGASADAGHTERTGTIADVGRTGYYDISVESEPLFEWEQNGKGPDLEDKRNRLLSMQFYQGSPVQLWSEMTSLWSWEICLYRSDGSRETMMPIEYGNKGGYLDEEGNVYLWTNYVAQTLPDGTEEKKNAVLKKYLASGEVLFEEELDEGQDILNIRQTADGRVYLAMRVNSTGEKWIRELDPAAGVIRKPLDGKPAAGNDSDLMFGVSGEYPAAFSWREFAEVHGEDGTQVSVLSLEGTTYTRPRYHNKIYLVQDFRILEDGSVEILWAPSSGSTGLREKLWMAEVEKTLVTLSTRIADTWLSTQISLFNRSNGKYQVVLDTGSGDWEDDARLASVQIAAGKGPDILSGGLMEGYIPGLLEKGALEDLSPYLERSGIREEDYFPFAFSSWRDGGKIYSVSPESPSLAGYCMDSAVLGGTEEPDIEQLVDVLLAGKEEAVFLEEYDSQKLLMLLLKGSDTLWGMVDWEAGSCDFSGELFAKILETAVRYGDKDGVGEKTYLAKARRLSDVFHFDELAERRRDGKVVCGVLFDDGCHAAVTSWNTLAVNAASPNKEGAWEFLSFLLGEEAQSATYTFPAGREAFELWLEGERAEVADGRVIHEMQRGARLPDGTWEITNQLSFSADDITDEIVEEFVETLEGARPYPLRTAPILEIVGQEAADFFYGSKDAAQVAEVIKNRVQLYLNEGK